MIFINVIKNNMNLQCNIEVNNPHASPVIIGCRMANGKNFTITNNTIVSFKLREKITDIIDLYMLNKSSKDTTIDKNGNIIDDVFVRFSSIIIDGENYFNKIEKYSTCFNNTTGKFYQGFGTLHHNGYCRLKIKKPLCYFDFMVGNYNVNTSQDNLREFTNL